MREGEASYFVAPVLRNTHAIGVGWEKTPNQLYVTCSGGFDAMVNGAPSSPRLVTAVDPRTFDT